MMEQLCGESGDSQKKMHAEMQMSIYLVQATGAGRGRAVCLLAAVGRRSAEAGADCGTISSAGRAWVACVPASAAADCSFSRQSSFQQRAAAKCCYD